MIGGESWQGSLIELEMSDMADEIQPCFLSQFEIN
jgi:hypothetical protein